MGHDIVVGLGSLCRLQYEVVRALRKYHTHGPIRGKWIKGLDYGSQYILNDLDISTQFNIISPNLDYCLLIEDCAILFLRREIRS